MINFLKRKDSIYWILGINLIIRLVIVSSTNLGTDEVYYVLYAMYPDFSYFDHPPLVGLLIRLSTFNLSFVYYDFFVRLGSLIIGTVNIYLIYQIGTFIKSRTSGIIGALLLSSSFYSSIIVGTFILPDTPLSLFWLLSILAFVHFISDKKEYWLMLFGLTVGFALLSKYQAVFLWVGAIIYFLIYNKKTLITPKFWFSIFISILIFTPVIWWNLTSEYSGILYHSNRVGNGSWIPSVKNFFPTFFGQIFYNNPFNVFLIILSLLILIKKGRKQIDPKTGFLLAISLPLIFITTAMSMYNKTLPHWSGPSFFALILLVGYIFNSEEISSKGKTFRNAIVFGQIFFFLVIALALFQIKTGILIDSFNDNPQKTGHNDFTIDLGLWDEISTNLKAKIARDNISAATPQNYVILTDNWFPASHIDYYYAMPNKIPLYVIGESNKQHQYMKINVLRDKIPLHSNAYYITTSQYYSPPKQDVLERFESIEGPEIIPIYKMNKHRVNLFIYKMTNLKNNLNLTQ